MSGLSLGGEIHPVFDRERLIKFGSLLKKEISRWYELDRESHAIEYYELKNSKRAKGRILLKEIKSMNIVDRVLSAKKNRLITNAKSESRLEILLHTDKIVYLF